MEEGSRAASMAGCLVRQLLPYYYYRQMLAVKSDAKRDKLPEENVTNESDK
jgi:hypothetical protein